MEAVRKWPRRLGWLDIGCNACLHALVHERSEHIIRLGLGVRLACGFKSHCAWSMHGFYANDVYMVNPCDTHA